MLIRAFNLLIEAQAIKCNSKNISQLAITSKGYALKYTYLRTSRFSAQEILASCILKCCRGVVARTDSRKKGLSRQTESTIRSGSITKGKHAYS